MDHIMQSLLALDKVMGERQFLCGESVTMMDIIFYNELSQVLFLHNLFKKVTKNYPAASDSSPQMDQEVEIGQIRVLDNIVKWYTKNMQLGDQTNLSIKKYDYMMRTMMQ